jgi:uncharacterized membrane protein YdbT with pleckstrin-like domain
MIKLEENEKLIKVFRKHYFSVLLEFLVLTIIVFLPIIFFLITKNILFFDISLKNIYLLLFFYCLFLVLAWMVGAIFWIDYYLDMWILTDKRLIDVEQKGLFFREISSLRLDRIQDVKIVTKGLIQTLLKMGDIHVQTASSQKEFIIYQVNNPDLVKQFIMKAHNLEMEKVQVVKIKET